MASGARVCGCWWCPVTDLDAAIRARLDGMIEDPGKSYESCAGCEFDCNCQVYVDYQAALRAVLDLHPRHPSLPNECFTCGSRWPCRHLREIAAALGVEADR